MHKTSGKTPHLLFTGNNLTGSMITSPAAESDLLYSSHTSTTSLLSPKPHQENAQIVSRSSSFYSSAGFRWFPLVSQLEQPPETKLLDC